MIKKAMILAAGFGSRLGNITQNRPKALLEVGGKTMLERVVERLKASGVESIVINLHYLGERIQEYCSSKQNFGIEVNFSQEKEILGTGGGIKAAESYFVGESNFYIYNADVYCELDLKKVAEHHVQRDLLATLVVNQRDTKRVLLFDEEFRLVGWKNRESGEMREARTVLNPTELGFCGIHVVSTQLFDFMRNFTGEFGIFDPYLTAIRAGEQIGGFALGEEYWIDIGKPKELAQLQERLGGGSDE